MIDVYTSMIESSTVDPDTFSERFDLLSISHAGIPVKERAERIPELLTELYRSGKGKILALVKDRKDTQRHVALLAKGARFQLNNPDIALRTLNTSTWPEDWLLFALLVRALPSQLAMSPDSEQRWFQADGLFYISAKKPLPRNKGMEIICTRIEPRPTRHGRGRHLSLGTCSFTPLSLHRRDDGSLRRRARNRPRFQLDIASQTLHRHTQGEYVMLPRFSSTRNRVDALDIRPSEPERYMRSRTGALSAFLRDFERAYAGIASIKLRHLSAIHIKTNDKAINASYEQLFGLIRQQRICIIDNLEDSATATLLQQELTLRGLQALSVPRPDESALNIQLHMDEEYYNEQEIPDPYQIARETHPEAVIQSCTPATLSGSASHVVDVLLKELLLKQEVQHRKLLLDYPELPDDLIVMQRMKLQKKQRRDSSQQSQWACAQVQGNTLQCWIIDHADMSRQLAGHASSHQFKRLESYSPPMVIFDSQRGELMLLQDTEALSLPNHQILDKLLTEIDQTRSEPIPAILLQEFLAQHPDHIVLHPQLKKALAQSVLGVLEPDALASIGYKSKSEKTFHDHLAERGYRLTASFSSSSGPLQSTSNIWLVPEHGLYCAGPKGSPQRNLKSFSHIYHLDTAGRDFPEWFIKSLQVWHVRHRNATVLPYIFKHLNEYCRWQEGK